MKRTLLAALSLALLLAACGSGSSATSAAKHPTTTVSRARHHKPKPRRKVVHHRKVIHHRKVVHHGQTAVTTSAVTTSSVVTTSAAPPPPPPPTHTHTSPPVTTHTVVPTTTHQVTTTQHHTHTSTTTQGYCLSVTARIDTPQGSLPVAQIKSGMLVWSTDRRGRRIAERVLKVHHTHVPSNHLMVRLRLADGRHLLVSLGHPRPNGQPVSTLVAGQRFEGSRVVSDTRIRYGRPYTYDLLPAGPTHTYFADGILLGSTLAPPLTHPF